MVRRSAIRYATPTIVAMAVIVTGGFLDGDARRVARAIGIGLCNLDGGVLLVPIDLILVVTLVVEHLRIEGPRASAPSVDDGRVVDDAAQ
jgi:hypothetical protein